MDWSNVTLEELVDALKEVEWSTSPRPLSEFFSKFTPPTSYAKWTSRLKCNVYYYRTNYFLLLVLTLALSFARNPPAVVAVLFAALSAMILNDSFALALNDKLMRAIRKLSPPLAAKLRGPTMSGGVRGRAGASSRGVVRICGQDRRRVAAVLLLATSVLLWLTSALRTVAGAFALAAAASLLHASFRSPNLKARLNSFREEFRQVWRGYSDA